MYVDGSHRLRYNSWVQRNRDEIDRHTHSHNIVKETLVVLSIDKAYRPETYYNQVSIDSAEVFAR